METSLPTPPDIDLSTPLYYQIVHTLTGLLPPPIDNTPEALHTRNHAAIAKVAALLPVNANEADLAAQCIAARAQAEDLLRLLRQHAGDIGLVMRLNAQYGSMVRTSLSVHGRLMRVQALRHKRDAIDGAANQDAWTLHVAERSMLQVVNPDARQREATSPENGTDSQDAAFETLLSAQLPRREARRPHGIWLYQAVRETMAEPPANGHENPPRADHGCHIDGQTAPTRAGDGSASSAKNCLTAQTPPARPESASAYAAAPR